MVIYQYDDSENAEDRLVSIPVTPDDRDCQVRCNVFVHQFAPMSLECACGKHKFKTMAELLGV